MKPNQERTATRGAAAVLLLIVAIGGTLLVPCYARTMPKLGDVPFFYWYQFIWVPVSAILCWICYLLLKKRPVPQHGRGARR